MKVVIINGSPKKDGNTAKMLHHIEDIFHKNGIETVFTDVPPDIKGCIACRSCVKSGKCFADDEVNNVSSELETADGILLGSPVYYSGISGSMKAFLDRLFYSSHAERRGIAAGAVVSVRRAGGTAALDQLNHYLLYGGYALAGSTYWPMVYGNKPGEVFSDAEGVQTAENLAENMIFLMKSLALGKEKYGLPSFSPKVMTNFIR